MVIGSILAKLVFKNRIRLGVLKKLQRKKNDLRNSK